MAENDRRRWLIGALVSCAFVAAALVYGYFQRAQLSRLAALSLAAVLVAVGSRVLAFFAHNGALYGGLRRFAPRLGFGELCVVSTGGFFAKQILPGFGAIAVRAGYLKGRHGAALGEVLAASALWVASSVLTSALIAAAALGVLGVSGRGQLGALWIGVALAVAAGLLPFVVGTRWSDALGRRVARLAALSAAWRRLLGARALVLGVLAASLLWGVAGFTSFGVLYAALSSGAGAGAGAARSRAQAWALGGAVQAITSIGHLVSLTPGNLGSYEWLVAAVGGGAQLSLMLCMLSATLFRVAGALASLLGGALALPLRRLGHGGDEQRSKTPVEPEP